MQDLDRLKDGIQEEARERIARYVAPIAASKGPGERLTNAEMRKVYKALAPMGYLGSTIPKEAGGAGLSYVQYGLLLEALAHSPVLVGEIVPPRSIFYLGNEAQKERWLPRLLAGDLVATAAITEPQAGSDLRGMTTELVEKDGGKRLVGRKKWIKLGGIADAMTVLVITDPTAKPKLMSRLFIERAEVPWVATELPCIGIRNQSFAEVAFNDLPIPDGSLLGDSGAGVEGFKRGIEASRALLGMQAAGLGREAVRLAIEYAKDRTAFGRPLAKFQGVQMKLADAASAIEAARALSIESLRVLDSGRRCPREASMAKVYATEAAVSACTAAMSTMGAYGLSEAAGVERLLREAMMLTVIDGTSDIQRLIVGREEFGMSALV
ncbi:acyl-CoA dehydrogenase family protein [Oceanibacterium hippocampi]|uniref:Acyl-CoA dehydrogenase n=1 Tax=Oceanibacterium hippocampi TaxID=745714 RepID=A0A1Y5TNK9_9PROT|nr:acyl-CoA dehydrogenase family protein [Oceanibacterium hippocampi]SLN64474.1 Acyl-CoA dehydrogenase [Oceanibacterium hippocampi]